MAEDPTVGGESDVESVYGDDEGALGWYAAAAGEDEASDGEEETELPQEEEPTADDPYLAATDDPYGAVSDPYGGVDETAQVEVAQTPAPTVSVPPVIPSSSSTSTHADIGLVGPDGAKISDRLAARRAARRAAAEADTSAPWRQQPPKKVQKTQAQVSAPPPSPTPSVPSTAAPTATSPSIPSATSTPTPPPPMPSLTSSTPQVAAMKPPLESQLPPPAPPMPEETDVNMTSASEHPEPEPLEPVVEEVPAVPTPALDEDVAMVDEVQAIPEVVAIDDMTWDEKVVVVKQGQLYIEVQRRNPPMSDSILMTFCDWLDAQMPLVVSSFPYIKKSGAYVDLSDNLIGPDGLDKLFRVLRDHRVPCVVIKAFRNLLDDSIVDTLVEYLYTQPEAFPMHGIHMSHNNITDKGAFRLIQAAAKCGHYPRLTSRLPLWLRLECNNVFNPQRVIIDSNASNFNVCLMGNGTCSRPDCNHYSGVHVQLPYFFHQQTPGNEQERIPKPAPIQPPATIHVNQQSQVTYEELGESDGTDLLSIYRTEDPATGGVVEPPDWRRKERLANTMQAAMMVPAPKRQDFTPAPKKQVTRTLPPQSKAMASQSKAIPSRPPPPFSQTFGVAEESPGFVPLVSDDWQVSSPYLDSSVIGDDFEASQFASNGTFGDGDLAAGGPSCGCGKKGFGKGKVKGWNDGKGWKNTGNKDKFGGKGWKNDKKGGWKGNAWEHDDGSGGYQQPLWGQDSWHDGKDGKGKGGKGKGKRGVYWQGPSLMVKVKKDIQIMEGDTQLGFMWQYQGDGIAPRITHVDFGSKVSQVTEAGSSLLRMNGLDATMLTEKQITDLLKQRPLALRFGDQ